MDNKRSELRKHFVDEANQSQSIKMHSERSAQLSEIEETIANAFKSLLDLIDGKVTKTEIINHLDSIKTPDVENVVKALNLLDKDVLSTKIDTKPLLDALNGLKREITLIPAKMPTQKELKDIKVSNLSEIKLDTSAVEKAIKGLDLKVDVKAPIVNVEKTDIEPLRQVMLDLLKAINKQEPVEEVKVNNLKDIPLADLTKLEKGSDEQLKQLKLIAEKKSGGSGGGGNGSPYTDNTGITKNVILDNSSVPISKKGMAQKITVSGANTFVAIAPIGSSQSSAVWRIKKVNVTGGDTVITWCDGDDLFNNIATDLTVLSYS